MKESLTLLLGCMRRMIKDGVCNDLEIAGNTFSTNFFGVVEIKNVFSPMPLTSTPYGGAKIVLTNSLVTIVLKPIRIIYNTNKEAAPIYISALDVELVLREVIVVI